MPSIVFVLLLLLFFWYLFVFRYLNNATTKFGTALISGILLMTSYWIQNFPILSLTAFHAFLCFFLLVEKSDVHSIKKKKKFVKRCSKYECLYQVKIYRAKRCHKLNEKFSTYVR